MQLILIIMIIMVMVGLKPFQKMLFTLGTVVPSQLEVRVVFVAPKVIPRIEIAKVMAFGRLLSTKDSSKPSAELPEFLVKPSNFVSHMFGRPHHGQETLSSSGS